jgi:hypothetical protein
MIQSKINETDLKNEVKYRKMVKVYETPKRKVETIGKLLAMDRVSKKSRFILKRLQDDA